MKPGEPDWLIALALELPGAVWDDVNRIVQQERAQSANCQKLLRSLKPKHLTTEFLDALDDDERTGRRGCTINPITIAQARELLAVLDDD